MLVVAALRGAASGVSNFFHDIGGYLGKRLIERCAPELLVRWLQFGCFTPLMHAHGRMPQEPWHYHEHVVELYRAYGLLHEQLVPYVRAAARTAAQTGVPIIRPLCLIDSADPLGWEITDAYGYGPSLWVAPVLDEGARVREVALPRGRWIETWSGHELPGGGETVVAAPLERIRSGCAQGRSSSAIRRMRCGVAWRMRPSPSARWWRRSRASRRWGAAPCGWPTVAGSAGGTDAGSCPMGARFGPVSDSGRSRAPVAHGPVPRLGEIGVGRGPDGRGVVGAGVAGWWWEPDSGVTDSRPPSGCEAGKRAWQVLSARMMARVTCEASPVRM